MKYKPKLLLFVCVIVYLVGAQPSFAAESDSVTITVTVLSSPAVVYDPKVTPRKASESENFTYSVYYYHPDGQPLDTAQVKIDGTSYDMSLKEGTVDNGLYAYTTNLAGNSSHTYSFIVKAQGSMDTITCPSISEYQGPIICTSGAEVVVDDFQDTSPNTNSLGFWTDDDGTCATDIDTAGAHQISWNDKTDYWYTVLWDNQAPLDASAYNKLSFAAMGNAGSESFQIELQDIYGKKEVLSSDYVTLSANWQEIAVSLNDLVFQGINIRKLKAIALLFKEESLGTIYIDDLKFSYDANSEYTPPIFAQQKLRSQGAVQVIGRHLFVDGVPFLVKAVGYQPTPVGLWPGEWDKHDTAVYNRDFPLLKAMGANAVKTWAKVTQELLDTAQANNIKVCAGFWVDTTLDLSNSTIRANLISEFSSYATEFKAHPAILMWVIGNEQNYFNGDNKEWYVLANEMAKAVYEIEGSNYHPVAVNNGELNNAGYSKKNADDASLSYIDVWALNVYRGRSFGDLFHDLEARTSKPIFVAEYGVDALNNTSQTEDQQSQALWDTDMYNEVSYSGGCIGGALMAYSDEWWKAGSPSTHDTTAVPWSLSTQPDGYSNEEWYGIVLIADNGSLPDIVTPRQVWTDLGKRFKETTRSFLNIIQPQPPSTLTASAEPAIITLAWQPSPAQDIAGYCIYRSQSAGSGFVRIAAAAASVTQYQDKDLPVTTYYYVVTAYDSSSPAIESSPSNQISANALNKAPVLDSIGNKEVNEDATLAFQIAATDDNGDALTYSASNLPSGASFDPNTQVFSWTPTHSDVRVHSGIHFEVSDGQLTGSEDISIEVKDITAPLSPTITSPAPGYTNKDITQIQGIAEPGSVIKVYNNNEGLSGAATTDSNGDYTLTLDAVLLTEAIYSLTATAADTSNNTSPNSSAVSVILDKTPPACSIIIDAGAEYTASTSVKLNVSAVDLPEGIGKLDKMVFSNDGKDWPEPEDYNTKKDWDIPSGDGEKRVCVKFSDKAGNWSDVVSDVISLDTTAPATTDSGIDDDWHKDPVTVTLTPSDSTSGVKETYYSTDNSDPNIAYTSSFTVSDEGTYTIKYYSIDNAGIREAVKTAKNKVKIDKTAPSKPAITDDGDSTASTATLHATWSSSDDLSGIKEYLFAVGKSAGATDVLDWTQTTATEVNQAGLNLVQGQMYYISVKAQDNAGCLSQIATTDGIVVNKSTPKISSISPVSGVILYADNRILIEVTASDTDGDAIKYQFLIDGSVVQDLGSAPNYEWDVGAGDMGIHSVEAKVDDSHYGADAATSNCYVANEPVFAPE